ncbi:MAG: metallophosphoesterase [Thiohalocapsa sp.]
MGAGTRRSVPDDCSTRVSGVGVRLILRLRPCRLRGVVRLIGLVPGMPPLPLFSLVFGLLLTMVPLLAPLLAQDQVPTQPQPLRFLALGDIPYSGGEMDFLRTLLRETMAQRPPFIIHVGDIKAGNQPCSDARIQSVADLFREQPAPLFYTPGDNEWTDCHRQRAGSHDPLERLGALRRIMFSDPSVLHTEALQPVVPDPAYPENLYFHRDGALIALVHVVGSNNNFRPNDSLPMAEYRVRAAANRALLKQAAQAANRLGASAFVIALHANPLFEEQGARRGFVPLKEDLRRLLASYPGPVLLIHGDTHRFRFDQPLTDADGNPIERFSRLEVPGSPSVAGVWVTVDTAAVPAFAVEVVYPNTYGSLF